jgi:hypothetical protein
MTGTLPVVTAARETAQTIDTGWQCPISGRPCSQICSSSHLDGSVPCTDANELVDRCGDGIVKDGEECDCGDGTVAVPVGCLGPNGDNTYGGCTTNCVWGHRCGDGIVDPGEECDLRSLNGWCVDSQGKSANIGCGKYNNTYCPCPGGTNEYCTANCHIPVPLI